MVICGDADLLTPLVYSQEIAAELPDAELVVVEHGGHVVLLELPDEVDDAIERFLERLS
jgi:pimeloyl-ACP methyl ester carboxylesterase